VIGLIAVLVVLGALVLGIHLAVGAVTGPAGVLLLMLAGLVTCGLVFCYVKARDALEDYGVGAVFMAVFYWHSGLPYHGEPVTNATWHYRGTRALTETGHARRCYYWPKKRLAWLRITRSVGVLGALFGLAVYPEVTQWLLLGTLFYGAWSAGNRFWEWLDEAAFHRMYTQPAHLAAAPIADIPLTYRPQGWLTIERDRTKVVAHLPVDYAPEERRDKRLIEALAERVGIEEAQAVWKLSGNMPRLILTTSPHAPRMVTLESMLPVIARSRWDELVLGMGRGKRPQPVIVSLQDDSPHMGESMGSGAGKTVLSRLIIAQWLMKGGVAYVLNPKRRGYQWAKDLPNCRVAETDEQCFMMMTWLGQQLDDRQEVASNESDWDDHMPEGLLGERVLVVVEEMNLLVAKQRKFWKRNQLMAAMMMGWDEDTPLPKDSPALDGLETLAFAGRQNEVYVLFIAQRLSSKVISGDVLENVGIRMMGRYSQRNVNMMAPDRSAALPVSDSHPGRIQVIVNGAVHECQVAYSDEAWVYRAMALVGEGQVPEDLPEMCYARSVGPSGPVRSYVPRHRPGTEPRNDTRNAEGASSGHVSLKVAVARGLTSGLTYRALTTLKSGDADFPQEAVHSATVFGAHLYDEETLVAYCRSVVAAREERKREAARRQGMPV
jgi:hypothetical protein